MYEYLLTILWLGQLSRSVWRFFFHFGFNAIEIDIIRLPVQRASTKLITLNKTGIPATSQFPILFNPINLGFQVEDCRNRLCLCKNHRHEGCSCNLNISLGRLRALFVSKFIPKLDFLCTCALCICQVVTLGSENIYGIHIWT